MLLFYPQWLDIRTQTGTQPNSQSSFQQKTVKEEEQQEEKKM